MEFENINFLLKRGDCDLSPFLFCPESYQDEEELKEYGADEDEIAYVKLITTEAYHPASVVLGKVSKAIELAKSYDEDLFESEKDIIVSDLGELEEVLSSASDSGVEAMLVRG